MSIPLLGWLRPSPMPNNTQPHPIYAFLSLHPYSRVPIVGLGQWLILTRAPILWFAVRSSRLTPPRSESVWRGIARIMSAHLQSSERGQRVFAFLLLSTSSMPSTSHCLPSSCVVLRYHSVGLLVSIPSRFGYLLRSESRSLVSAMGVCARQPWRRSSLWPNCQADGADRPLVLLCTPITFDYLFFHHTHVYSSPVVLLLWTFFAPRINYCRFPSAACIPFANKFSHPRVRRSINRLIFRPSFSPTKLHGFCPSLRVPFK